MSRAPTLLAALGLLALIALRLQYGIDNLVDDAYITLRHSLNIAQGHGFVYNRGEWVLGTTTPLYAGLVGLLAKAHPTPATVLWISVILNTLADVAVFLLLHRIAARLTGSAWFAAAVSFCYALDLRAIEYSSGGMELSLYTALTLTALLLVIEDRDTWAGAVAGVVVLCRPDGMWLLLCVLGAVAYKSRGLPVKASLAALAVITPWLITAILWYGQPIPQSVLAKSAHPFKHAWYQAGLQEVRQWGGLYFGRELFYDLPGRIAGNDRIVEPPWWAFIPFLMNLALAVIGARALAAPGEAPWPQDKRRFATALLGIFAVGYAGMYAAGNPAMFGWYQVPLEVFGLLFVGAGIWSFGRKHTLAVALLLMAMQATQFVSREGYVAAGIMADRWNKFRERRYMDVARAMNQVVDENTVIANPEIGAFGYVSRAKILDPVGLVSRGVSRYYPLPDDQLASNYAVPTQVLLDFKPEYFVCLELFIRNSAMKSPEFHKMYVLEGEVENPAFGSRNLYIFRRRDVQPGKAH